ncbi:MULTISPECIES: FecR domain-containing protein [Pseudomonas]|uniref:LysM domain-containing protein n=1 Tax=Pseudomonas fulva TaxID=47880 RepID=A0A0D0KVV4_9PSED|nr:MULTISPECIES: FecR domain-containing protein [Pseudomonas]KIQ02534.1 hypothetical protein RU08_06825 [Pseudomonas fulva]
MRSTLLLSLSLCLGLSSSMTPPLALAAAGEQIHVVEPGDTLWDIAEHYLHMPSAWTRIQKLNALGSPLDLTVGTRLIIPKHEDAFPITILHLQGEAWVHSQGQPEIPLTEGMKLNEGQSVRTGEATFVTMGFYDGAKSVLTPLSLISLGQNPQYGAAQVILQKGEVESYVPRQGTPFNSFEVITPQGVLGVRGTHFVVRIDTPENSLVEVLEGKVVVSSPSSASRPETWITPNQGLVLNETGALHTSPLLAATQRAERVPTPSGTTDWRIIAQKVSGAVEYIAQVSSSADFLNIDQEQTATDPEFQFQGLDDAFYYVRVIAIDAQGLQGEPGEFLMLYRTANGGVDVQQIGQRTHFNWNAAPLERGLRYRLKIDTDSELESPFLDRRDIRSTAVDITNLPPGLLYWQVSTDEDEQPTIVGAGTLR